MTTEDRAFREWGFTNAPMHIERVRAWRDAAVTDGWSIEPTYQSEDVSRASRLKRDGFVAQVLTRDGMPYPNKYRYEAKVAVWGPDGLAIEAGETYSMDDLYSRLKTCLYCRAQGVETFRVGFAGRACSECLPTQQKIQEYPGWTN